MADIYEQSAEFVKDLAENFDFSTTKEECDRFYADFQALFAPDVLRTKTRDELPELMFSSKLGSKNYLTYWLEFKDFSREWLGSISGGSAFIYPLHQNEDGVWITGPNQKPQSLSAEEAKDIASQVRDMLVKGADLIKAESVVSAEDYKVLAEKLKTVLGKYAERLWVHKYYQFIFPDKFAAFQNRDWQSHILYLLNILPEDNNYVRSGQIALVKNKTDLSWAQFAELLYYFGSMDAHKTEDRLVRFIRIGVTSTDKNQNKICYMQRWLDKKYVAIGWNEIGGLDAYQQDTSFDKKALSNTLYAEYYSDKPKGRSVASRKAGELRQFFEAAEGMKERYVFVAMNGQTPYALGTEIGPYLYQENEPFAHTKGIQWHVCFDEGEKMPVMTENNLTACVDFKKPENLLYLHRKLFRELDHAGTVNIPAEVSNAAVAPAPSAPDQNVINAVPDDQATGNEGFLTYEAMSGDGYNKIFFGAPGTGKSFKLEKERIDVCKDIPGSTYERVTFHPEYSYAQFVGTYKPRRDQNGDITYSYVPGPFVRMLVNAYKAIQKGQDTRHILVIEEINRAKPAAVFGDVFQLLDRDENGISKYEISTGEDLRAYLYECLGGREEDYASIRIPGNMHIWATMNSADQGVYPMDTAFKRRWDFEYVDIDDGQDSAGCTFMIKGVTYDWNNTRHAINDKLVKLNINEDKLLGPFFIDSKYLKTYDEETSEEFVSVFKNKVIMYLFEDAARQFRSKLFTGCDMRYSLICKKFDDIGMGIFGDGFIEACSAADPEGGN